MTISTELRKYIVGKKIVKIELNRFYDGVSGFTFDPVIILANGARLAFVVHETEVGEYGIEPVVVKPSASGRG